METYSGHVRTPGDAIILFEACRVGLLPRVQRRLSEKERQSIKSGSVFVWDEREAGMRRWTDGKSWSASRVSGSFLTYREMEGKRGGGGLEKNANRDGMQNDPDSDGGPDGYRYKPDGLMKQSFSITTSNSQHLHLISYFSRSTTATQNLMQPSNDPHLRHIRPEKGMYPESTVHEQSNIPAVTRGPMSSPNYTQSQTQSQTQPSTIARPPQYGHGPPWAPPSPMHTPPLHQQYTPYYHQPQTGPYPGSPLQNMHYPPPYQPPPGLTSFDRPPPPLSNNGLPPPSHQYPPHQYPPPPNYQTGYSYNSGYSSYQPPPLQAPTYPPPHQQPYNYSSRGLESASAASSGHETSTSTNKAERQDSHQNSHRPEESHGKPHSHSPPNGTGDHQPQAGGAVIQHPSSSGQTIPSISAMLNSSREPPPSTSNPGGVHSKSPNDNNTPHRPLQDIPSYKLGFEANRDLNTLRNLDKTTLKF